MFRQAAQHIARPARPSPVRSGHWDGAHAAAMLVRGEVHPLLIRIAPVPHGSTPREAQATAVKLRLPCVL